MTYAPKKSLQLTPKKNKQTRLTLICAIKVRFPTSRVGRALLTSSSACQHGEHKNAYAAARGEGCRRASKDKRGSEVKFKGLNFGLHTMMAAGAAVAAKIAHI